MERLTSFFQDENGAAAVEMALITPLLIVLMFGAFEMGHFFWNEHIVVKSVRDAARFASRQNSLFSPETCTEGAITSAETDNLARYGKLVVDVQNDKPLVRGWTTAVSITLECPDVGAYAGIYDSKASIPVVMVSASVAYPAILGSLGFDTTGINLNAKSRAAVTGI